MADLAVDCRSHNRDSLVFGSVQRLPNNSRSKKRTQGLLVPQTKTEQAQIEFAPYEMYALSSEPTSENALFR